MNIIIPIPIASSQEPTRLVRAALSRWHCCKITSNTFHHTAASCAAFRVLNEDKDKLRRAFTHAEDGSTSVHGDPPSLRYRGRNLPPQYLSAEVIGQLISIPNIDGSQIQ